jgi:hypothetical protein
MSEQAIELPPLPERFAVLPKLVLPDVHGMGPNTTVFQQQDAFTADQMREYARQAVLAERERCAQIAETARCGSYPTPGQYVAHLRPAIASAIRDSAG